MTIAHDPFIASSNSIFAIPGLRAPYFELAAMIHRFTCLKYALAGVLMFIGMKIFAVGLIDNTPPAISLGVTFGLIAGGVAVTLWNRRHQTATRPATAIATPTVVGTTVLVHGSKP